MNCSYKKKVTATLTSIVLMSSFVVAGATTATAAEAPTSMGINIQAAVSNTLATEQAKIFEFETLINNLRAEYGLKPLKFNATTAEEALAWSKKMGKTNTYRHMVRAEFNQSFETLYTTRKENIAMGLKNNVSSMFTQWMASPSHRSAMLDPNIDSFGVGFYDTVSGDLGQNNMYGTTIFHDSRASNLPQTYTNSTDYFTNKSALSTGEAFASAVPANPTFNNTAQTFTIPSASGIRYINNDTMRILPAGTYPMYGMKTNISAFEQEGYIIKDGVNKSWTNQNAPLDGKWPYTAQPPQFFDNANGMTINLPYDDTVEYFIDGVKAQMGSNTISKPGLVTVTAKLSAAEAPYSYLDGYNEPWTYNFGTVEVTPKLVTFDLAKNTYTIPQTTGVTYSVGGVAKAAGTYTAATGSTVNITVKANSGYSLFRDTNFNQNYTFSLKEATASAPSFNASTFQYTIPTTTGVVYKVNGNTVNAGTYTAAPASALNVTATAVSGYKLMGVTSWNYTYGNKTITANAPTFDVANDSYTIPTTVGVDYYVNNVKKAAGNYTVTQGSITVKAQGQTGYSVQGINSWTKSFDDFITPVTPKAPTFNSSTGAYVIPSTTGVVYYVNGTAKAAGSYSLASGGEISIIAEEMPGYAVQGIYSWSFAYTLTSTVVKAPTSVLATGAYTVPSTTGVDYYVNGTKVNAGTYNSNYSLISIEAKARAGYTISGTAKWSLDLRKVTVTPIAPTLDSTKKILTIPTTKGVDYYLNGVKKAAGKYTVSGVNVVFVESAAANYIVPDKMWSLDSRVQVATKAPSTNTITNQVVIPSVTGVVYYINGVKKTAGTYIYTGKGTVTASPVSGNYKLLGYSSWSFNNTNVVVAPIAPTFSASGNTVKIPSKSGVVYYINGVKKNAGTHSYSGTGTVTTKGVNANYSLSGTQTWKFDNRNGVYPSAPVFSASGNTVKIPSKSGVVYYINGVQKSAGTHRYTGTGTVTTKASSGYYKLLGTQTWKFDNRNGVYPTKPTISTYYKTIKIPSKTGVAYYINNVKKSAGTYKYYSRGTITTKASSGYYKLLGTQKWSFDNRNSVTPVKPTLSASSNTVKIPKKTGVIYYINGVKKNAGTYRYYNSGTITTKASSSSYKLSGTQSWRYDNRNAVTPTKPTFSASGNTVKIPSKTGVIYYINGVKKNAGTYKYYNSGTVTTKASSSSYKLSGTQSWRYDNRNVVTPTKPTFSASTDTVKIPSKTGVVYYINGVKKNTGTYKYRGTVKVTTKTTANYKLSGINSWSANL